MDTIFALASAPGKAGVAVIRISGHKSWWAAEQLTGKPVVARGMSLRTVRDENGAALDDALILSFENPFSFTGEDIVEIQCHGSIASINSVLNALSKLDDVRLANPGEFTRRALENGKLDLTQVEGLADLIDAETEAQRKQAHRVLAGDLGGAVDNWRRDLVRAASLIEATIDFADEDVPVDVTPEVNDLLSRVAADLRRETTGVRIAERVRTGFEVAIVGAPNVGKSTLLNALAGRSAAITSDIAGTTRDVIEVRMDLAGLPVSILDTAGIRETTDVVEGLGVELAKKRAREADIRVFLVEDPDTIMMDVHDDDIILKPKADLHGESQNSISGETGFGVDLLVSNLSKILVQRTASAGLATRNRHKVAMEKTLDALVSVDGILLHGPDMYDVAAEELRHAIRSLESLVGRIDVETLLDEIFSSFCLGK
jgi:tRNA modification GTPase